MAQQNLEERQDLIHAIQNDSKTKFLICLNIIIKTIKLI